MKKLIQGKTKDRIFYDLTLTEKTSQYLKGSVVFSEKLHERNARKVLISALHKATLGKYTFRVLLWNKTGTPLCDLQSNSMTFTCEA